MPRELSPDELSADDRFAIVVAKWNESITGRLLRGAVETLTREGVVDESIEVVWVPGAWEIPVLAQRLAKSGSYAAVLCLGAVIRGETSHDQHINRGVSTALQQIALASEVPVMFGILTCETLEQALQRAGGQVGNKGAQCAEAALTMARLLKSISH